MLRSPPMPRPHAWRSLASAALALAAPLAATSVRDAHAGPPLATPVKLVAMGDTPKPPAPPASPVTVIPPAPAQPAATLYDLPRVLAAADRNHPNIAASRARILQARAQLDEAHFAPFSQ